MKYQEYEEYQVEKGEELCNRYMNEDGILEFDSEEEFFGLLKELMPDYEIEKYEHGFAMIPKELKGLKGLM